MYTGGHTKFIDNHPTDCNERRGQDEQHHRRYEQRNTCWDAKAA